ncbi:hypothetical protein SOVF_194720 [Spinacia oleracea]|nr:hypothetical protein SOVF_194720 [Spinacia oleracea]
MEMEKIYTLLPLFAIIFFLYKTILPSNPKNKNLPPPSPPSIPILGHLHLLKPPFHRTLQSLSQRYGPIFSLRLGCQPVLVVSSPWAAEECFNQNDIVFANRPKFIIGEHLGYNHSLLIWSPYGEHWRNLRRVATLTMLSFRRINEAGPTRKMEIRNMISELLEGGTRKVNLNQVFGKLARNFVMRIMNGKPWEKMVMSPPANLMTVCDFLPVLRWVGFRGIEKELINMKKERDEFLQGLVDECRETRRRGLSCNDDEQNGKTNILIDKLLDLQEAEPEYYTDDFLKGFILV